MAKVQPEWIDGGVGGSLQKAYEFSESGDIFTNAEKGSVDIRGGETGSGQDILTVGYTGKVPSTAFSGRSARIATNDATLEDIQAGAMIGGHEGIMNQYSHGSVTLGGSYTEITDVSQNSSIQSSSYAKLKKAFHSSVVASAAYKDNIEHVTNSVSSYLGDKGGGFLGFSGMAEIRGTPEMFQDELHLNKVHAYPSVDGDTLLLGKYNITPLPITPSKVGIESNVSSFFEGGYLGTVLRKSVTEMLVAANDTLYIYNEETGEEEVILSRGANAFSEGGSSLGLDYPASAGIQDIKLSLDGEILVVLVFTGAGSRIVKVNPVTKTLHSFGGTGVVGFSGDGGLATDAQVSAEILSMAVHKSTGDVYFSDWGNKRIRRIAYGTGLISTFAGTGNWSWVNTGDEGQATSADIYPNGISFPVVNDSFLYLLSSNQLRKVNLGTGVISLVYTGTDARHILPWNQGGYEFLLLPSGNFSGNSELTLFSESFGSPILISEELLLPVYSIASKYATLIGTSDSFMDMVENSGIVSSSSTCITAYHVDRVPSRNTSIDSSAVIVVNDASCSKVSASSTVYMGAINKGLPDPEERKRSFIRNCEVVASAQVSLMDSRKTIVQGSATVSVLKGDQCSIISSNGVTGIHLVQSSVLASQDIIVGRVSPDLYLDDEEVAHSIIAANSQIDVHKMWHSSLLANTDVVLSNLTNTLVSACVSLQVGEAAYDTLPEKEVSLIKSVVLATDGSLIGNNTQVGVIASNNCEVKDNHKMTLLSSTRCVVLNNTRTVILGAGGAEKQASPTYIPAQLLENDSSAVIAATFSHMIKTTDSLLAAATDSGLGVPAPTGSTSALRYSEAFDGSSATHETTPPATGANSSTILATQKSELIKAVCGAILGGQRHSSQYNQNSVLLGGQENTNIYSDRTAILGGFQVAVGPFSHDSLISGNTVSTFKETKVSAITATSDSLVRETENALVSASTEVTAVGLDKSGVLLSSTVEIRDALWSAIIGSNFAHVQGSIRVGVLFSEEVVVEGTSDSALVLAASTAGIANGVKVLVAATLASSVSSCTGVLLAAAKESSIDNSEQSAVIAAQGAYVTGGSNSVVLGGIGGEANLPGQITHGAGREDGEEEGLFQSSKVLFSGICTEAEEKKLTIQNLAGKHLLFEQDSSYHVNIRMAAKAATGSVGLCATYEGSVSVDSAGTEVFEDITLKDSYGNTLVGILDASNITVGVTGTSGRELHILVTGATGVGLSTRWTAEVNMVKAAHPRP